MFVCIAAMLAKEHVIQKQGSNSASAAANVRSAGFNSL